MKVEEKEKERMFHPCLVCEKPTEKLHLKVNICYGCAAFYRRSVNSKNLYICKSYINNCNLKKQKCRLCRFNKCVELGLKVSKRNENIQLSTQASPKMPQIMLPIATKPDTSDPWNVVDLFHQINIIFHKNNNPLLLGNFDPFECFSLALSKLIEKAKPQSEPVIATSDLIRIGFKKKVAINAAALLTCDPNIQKLPLQEKLIIHDRFWQMFILLLPFYLTQECFGKDYNDRSIVDNFQYTTPEHSRTNLTTIDMSNVGTKTFILPYFINLGQVFKEFMNANLTFFEFAYICSVALWSVHEFPNISESTQNLAEKILEDFSTKLHDYYTKELRMDNYAARQAKLFKIINMLQKLMQFKSELLKAWNIFNFGKEAFPFCKFETNYCNYKNF